MRIPAFQQIIRWISYCVIGILGFSAVIDAINNALTLITPPVTYSLSIVAALLWIFVEIYVRHHPFPWVTNDGQTVQITRLGTKPKLVLLGVFISAWLPRLFGTPLTQEIQEPPLIRSLTLTVRLTCTVRTGEELPPSQVDFWPMSGDADAYLDGPAGRVRLQFESPVYFRIPDPDRITVINRFVLRNGSELENRPVLVLKNYHQLSVPVVTVVYGHVLDTMKLLEISLSVNGEDAMYESWEYDVPFQQGPRFDITLDSKSIRLSDE